MAEEKKHEAAKPKAKKKKLHSIRTTRADDGGFVHEHEYEDHNGHKEPPRFGGVSSDMQDLHDHMDDHFGEGAEQDDQGPQPDNGQQGTGPAAPAQAGPPAGAAE
jgi:hypothetical protein